MPKLPLAPDTGFVQQLSGSPLTAERLQEVLRAYEPILNEITKLRTLDLQNVHPAVLFDPTAPYRLT